MSTATADRRGVPLVRRHFTKADPLDATVWRPRHVVSPATARESQQPTPVEAPAGWSDTAVRIASERYFRTPYGSSNRETSVRQMISRVTRTIADWGLADGYFNDEAEATTFRDELAFLLVNQLAAFSTPVWLNVGGDSRPQSSSCFILAVEDSLESLLSWNATEAMIFSRGGGAGVNLSSVRGRGEELDSGGPAPGPVAFMRGTDAWAGAIKAGGTGRAAKMVQLDIDHPDIREFVAAKVLEEAKTRALVANYPDRDDRFALSLAHQNANHSVRLTDAFMEAVGRDAPWRLNPRSPTDQGGSVSARELLREISEAIWACGDPGVQFDTTVNRWHTTPAAGRINASNPCAEFLHVDNSACNLASLNLLKFRQADGRFDTTAFAHAIDLLVIAQEILIDRSSYPTDEIGDTTRGLRQLGLGFTNLGGLLMASGLPYDSREARGLAGAITGLLTGRAYHRSAQLARHRGPYEAFGENRDAHLAVVAQHVDAIDRVDVDAAPTELLGAARDALHDALLMGRLYGYRHSQVTALAPAGTISLLLDCETSGVEPDFALCKTRQLADGSTIASISGGVAEGLRSLGYDESAVAQMTAAVRRSGTLEAAPGLQRKHLPVFEVAVGPRPISVAGHLEMLAAIQPLLSGGISKTLNLPAAATREEIATGLMQAWRLGLKAVAFYRDGSKATQVLRVGAPGSTHSDVMTMTDATSMHVASTAQDDNAPEESGFGWVRPTCVGGCGD